jgi:hypothetical protein
MSCQEALKNVIGESHGRQGAASRQPLDMKSDPSNPLEGNQFNDKSIAIGNQLTTNNGLWLRFTRRVF